MSSSTARLKADIKRRAPFLVPLKRAPRAIARGIARAASRVAVRVPALRELRASALDRRRRNTFETIYRTNAWGGAESRSGIGSDLGPTALLRSELPRIVEQHGFRTMLDIPCGDFVWMQHVALDLDYVGADLVPSIIERSRQLFGNERRRFLVLDMVRDDLPAVDLVFCRDGLVHLSNEDALRALANVKRSGSRYLMATTFVNSRENKEIWTGEWRPLNLSLPPFGFPAPLTVVNERQPSDPYPDKSMAMWRVADLPRLRDTLPP